jgi:hypothetical protein
MTGRSVISISDVYRGSSSVGFVVTREARNSNENDSCLHPQTVRVYAREVKAKVVPFPRLSRDFDIASFMQPIDGTNPQVDHAHIFQKFNLDCWRNWYFVGMLN